MTSAAPVPAPVPQPWVIHCDGSAQPNPGRMGLGATLQAPDGVLHTLSLHPSTSGCNNEAEALALLAALQQAHALSARHVQVFSDSTILVEQLAPAHAGALQAPSSKLPPQRIAPLLADARAWLARFDSVQLLWIPRHRNTAADALARAALGMPPKPAALPKGRVIKRKRKP